MNYEQFYYYIRGIIETCVAGPEELQPEEIRSILKAAQQVECPMNEVKLELVESHNQEMV